MIHNINSLLQLKAKVSVARLKAHTPLSLARNARPCSVAGEFDLQGKRGGAAAAINE
jgi:hypothetical protein